jgi:hypothetical protein
VVNVGLGRGLGWGEAEGSDEGWLVGVELVCEVVALVSPLTLCSGLWVQGLRIGEASGFEES